MRILLTNHILNTRSGTEVVTRDLAFAFAAAGHQPMVYSPALGSIAEELKARDIPTVSHLADLPHAPDVIHGHQHLPTVTALIHFPRSPALFVCHDRMSHMDITPLFPRIHRYVAVDLNCRERLEKDFHVPEEKLRMIHNAVDLERFKPRDPLPAAPGRAVIFSNNAASHTHVEPVRAVCDSLGLKLDVIGEGVGKVCEEPERILGNYDIVFAKARCALESAAIGCAVVLCDERGLGRMLTTKNVETLRPWNFGMRTLDQPLDRAAIRREVQRYNAADAAKVSAWIRQDADLAIAAQKYLALYQEVIEAHATHPQVDPAVETQQYLAATLEMFGEREAELRHIREFLKLKLDKATVLRVARKLRKEPGKWAGKVWSWLKQ